MSKNQKNILIILAIVVAVFFILLFALKYYVIPLRERRFTPHYRQMMKNEQESVISALFVCPKEKGEMHLPVRFYRGDQAFMEMNWPDGRQLRLRQTISASGARYANEDESFVFWNKGNSAFIEENGKVLYSNCFVGDQTGDETTELEANLGLANPASQNCVKQGGTLKIAERGDGGQYGLCYFDDNRACEEWAMMRGDCPVGGVKTTGFDTEAQRYCAWCGGKTFAEAGAMCNFQDGSKCLADDYYKGTCQAGMNK